MANIVVNDIKLAGAELFGDYETFISDLEDNELQILGGLQMQRAICCNGCGGSVIYV